ncbi:MAG: hypothetical protein K6E63_12595 [Lachnospiraceae bacterium]|nr:hypothetical protein [Lachnospiraceae bacterium]
MNIRSMVICDRDRDYGGRLTEYIRRSECGYDVMLYTDPVRFLNEWQHKNISLLLMEEEFLSEDRAMDTGTYEEENISADVRFILTGDRNKAGWEGVIYKYQSAAGIIACIGGELNDSIRIINDNQRSEGAGMIGVYSPVSHVLKTTYAMTLGRILSKTQNVLYVNLEGYNGLARMLDIGSDLSLQDMIYEYSLSPGSLSGLLTRYVTTVDGLDMLRPARCPDELKEVEPSMWLSFLSDPAVRGKYDSVILDLSDDVRGTIDLMNVCSIVYMPVRRDEIAVAKLKDFDDSLLRYPGGEGIMNRIVRLKFPYFEDAGTPLNSHGNGMLKRYIRQEILKDDSTGEYEQEPECA